MQTSYKNIQEDMDNPNSNDIFTKSEDLLEHCRMDVIIRYIPSNESETFKDFPVIYDRTNQSINIYQLYNELYLKDHLKSRGILFYFDTNIDAFVHIGKEPNDENAFIGPNVVEDKDGRKVISLRIREKYSNNKIVQEKEIPGKKTVENKYTSSHEPISYKSESFNKNESCFLERESSDFPNVTEEKDFSELPSSHNPETEKNMIEELDIKSKPRTRHKERTIEEAMDIVVKWRNYYHGIFDPKQGIFEKMTLEDAAKVVMVPKKSLDDYMLIINQARKHGFDFLNRKHERFGVLRAFVKKHRKKKMRKNSMKEEDN